MRAFSMSRGHLVFFAYTGRLLEHGRARRFVPCTEMLGSICCPHMRVKN